MPRPPALSTTVAGAIIRRWYFGGWAGGRRSCIALSVYSSSTAHSRSSMTTFSMPSWVYSSSSSSSPSSLHDKTLPSSSRQQPRPPTFLRSAGLASTAHNHDTHKPPPFCCGNPNCEHQGADLKEDGYNYENEEVSASKHNHPHTHTDELPPCWACGKPTGCCNFFCACGKIQPLIGHCSYFETFGLPKSYDLDPKELERAFFELQKTMHPDRYMQKSSTEQDFSRSNSTYVNVAYRTLKDPTLRAKYLLQLEGVRALDERSKTADPALLMEVMELREEVDESRKPEALIRLIRRNRKAIDAVKKELIQLYTEKEWTRMVALTNRLQYLSKVGFEAREKLDLLEGEEEKEQRRARLEREEEEEEEATARKGLHA
ncbi:hypothetical protein VYU27_004331 [Nannochloropsis oceanica]